MNIIIVDARVSRYRGATVKREPILLIYEETKRLILPKRPYNSRLLSRSVLCIFVRLDLGGENAYRNNRIVINAIVIVGVAPRGRIKSRRAGAPRRNSERKPFSGAPRAIIDELQTYAPRAAKRKLHGGAKFFSKANLCTRRASLFLIIASAIARRKSRATVLATAPLRTLTPN